MNPHKILLVEDEQSDGNQIAHTLSAHDIEIVWVKTGEEALKALKSEDFSVVLIDISLPGINGLRLTEWIRKDTSLKTLPIIVLTKTKASLVEMASYEVGANYFLTKPVDLDEIDKAIRHFNLMGTICHT